MNKVEKLAYWKSIPLSAKIIMVAQTALIAFLSFWIYEEFQRNIYLQAYLIGVVGESSILILGGVSATF